jgi:HemY protein
MIKLYIFSLLVIVFALVVSLYLGFPADPGYLLISFGNYTFETSLFVLLVAITVIYLIVKLIIIIFGWVNPWHLIRFGRDYKKHRQSRKRSKTVEGLLYFTRGNWESSYKLLTDSSKDADASVVNYLAAAYAAYQNDNRDAWMKALEQAELEYPAVRSTINSLKAQLLFRSDQLEQCVAVLQQLKNSSLNDSSLLNLLKEVYLKLQDWDQLEKLLPALEKNAAVGAEELERIRVRIFMEKLYSMAAQQSDDPSQTGAKLHKFWKKAPARFREDERVVRHYTELLHGLSQNEDAAKAIEFALSKNWSDKLIVQYGEMDFGIYQKQLLQAESWLKDRPGNAALLLSLGRLALRCELWGKAKEYFETSISIEPTSAAHGEFARLLRSMGEEEASERHRDAYIESLGAQLPDLPLPDRSSLGAEK